MRRAPSFVTSLIATALLAACAQHHEHGQSQSSSSVPAARTTILRFSPNGEPLNGGTLGHPSCAEAIDQWFDRTDIDHDGFLTRVEFLADARTQFGRMDLDHDGFITSDELSAFRQPFTETRSDLLERQAKPAEAGQPNHRGSHRDRDANAPPPRPSGTRPRSAPDPVMSADTNLDFKVSLGEFLKQADGVFDGMDSDHDGRLSHAEALRVCPAESQ